MGAGNSRKIIIAQLRGPSKIMALRHGEVVVQQIEFWSKISSFPLTGSLSVKVLDLVKLELQQFEMSDEGKNKTVDWESFTKWQIEAREREDEVEEKIVSKLATRLAATKTPPLMDMEVDCPARLHSVIHLPIPQAQAQIQPRQLSGQQPQVVAVTTGTMGPPPPFSVTDPFTASNQAPSLLPPSLPQHVSPRAGDTAPSSEVRLNLPYIACPNPMPNAGNDPNYQNTVQIYRPWRKDEISEAAKSLADHMIDSQEFKKDMLALEAMYKPSAQEIESIMKFKLKLRYLDVKGDFDADLPRTDANFSVQLNQLLERVKERWPKRIDWRKIQSCTQKYDERFEDFYNRLEALFIAHSGLQKGTADYETLLKTILISNIKPKMSERVKSNLIGWESASLREALAHMKHAERVQNEIEEKTRVTNEHTAIKLQAAQLKFYSDTNNRVTAKEPPIEFSQSSIEYFPASDSQFFDSPACFFCDREGHSGFECRKMMVAKANYLRKIQTHVQERDPEDVREGN